MSSSSSAPNFTTTRPSSTIMKQMWEWADHRSRADQLLREGLGPTLLATYPTIHHFNAAVANFFGKLLVDCVFQQLSECEKSLFRKKDKKVRKAVSYKKCRLLKQLEALYTEPEIDGSGADDAEGDGGDDALDDGDEHSDDDDNGGDGESSDEGDGSESEGSVASEGEEGGNQTQGGAASFTVSTRTCSFARNPACFNGANRRQ